MSTERCDHCQQLRVCVPNLGRRMCGDCSWAEVQDQLKNDGLRVIENGRETTYRSGYVTPRKAQR